MNEKLSRRVGVLKWNLVKTKLMHPYYQCNEDFCKSFIQAEYLKCIEYRPHIYDLALMLFNIKIRRFIDSNILPS